MHLLLYLFLQKTSEIFIIYFLVAWGGVRLSPLGTSATNWPIVPARPINDVCGAVGGMRIGRGNRSTLRKPTPAPLRPPQIPYDYMGSNPDHQRLTACAMTRPQSLSITLSQKNELVFAIMSTY
jgi:hypothetical protein